MGGFPARFRSSKANKSQVGASVIDTNHPSPQPPFPETSQRAQTPPMVVVEIVEGPSPVGADSRVSPVLAVAGIDSGAGVGVKDVQESDEFALPASVSPQFVTPRKWISLLVGELIDSAVDWQPPPPPPPPLASPPTPYSPAARLARILEVVQVLQDRLSNTEPDTDVPSLWTQLSHLLTEAESLRREEAVAADSEAAIEENFLEPNLTDNYDAAGVGEEAEIAMQPSTENIFADVEKHKPHLSTASVEDAASLPATPKGGTAEPSAHSALDGCGPAPLATSSDGQPESPARCGPAPLATSSDGQPESPARCGPEPLATSSDGQPESPATVLPSPAQPASRRATAIKPPKDALKRKRAQGRSLRRFEAQPAVGVARASTPATKAVAPPWSKRALLQRAVAATAAATSVAAANSATIARARTASFSSLAASSCRSAVAASTTLGASHPTHAAAGPSTGSTPHTTAVSTTAIAAHVSAAPVTDSNTSPATAASTAATSSHARTDDPDELLAEQLQDTLALLPEAPEGMVWELEADEDAADLGDHSSDCQMDSSYSLAAAKFIMLPNNDPERTATFHIEPPPVPSEEEILQKAIEDTNYWGQRLMEQELILQQEQEERDRLAAEKALAEELAREQREQEELEEMQRALDEARRRDIAAYEAALQEQMDMEDLITLMPELPDAPEGTQWVLEAVESAGEDGPAVPVGGTRPWMKNLPTKRRHR